MAEAGIDTSPKFDRRPWGTFTVIDEGDNFKVKRIEVLPGKRLSYQKHAQRAEHWFVVQGTARVTLDDREINVSAGERSEEHTSELQSLAYLVCRLLLEKKKNNVITKSILNTHKMLHI